MMAVLVICMPAMAQHHDYSQDYLTFKVLTDGKIAWKSFGSETAKTISYSINDGEWTSITSSSTGETILVSAGNSVRFKGNNTSYATSRDNYAGFDGGTATFNIEGNIMSLIYGDNFVGQTTMSGEYNFCSLFKLSKCISAENLILPATTLTNDCYRAMFSLCTTLVTAPQLPATTLAKECYWYMFEACGITTAPDLLAPVLVTNCYGHMFVGCSSLNYIKCLATSGINTTNLNSWVGKKNAEATLGVAATGTFVKANNADWSEASGTSGIPTNWTIREMPDTPTISCNGFEIELSCTSTGAVIYYQLNHSGNYTQYTTPITITGDTFIECYSEKDGMASATISQTCEYDDRTIYEYSNQSLDSWTYKGNIITTPYSVNAIDGHSSSYAKGTFSFETDVNLRGTQPTYLWFQHADQSAAIYVDNNLVEKHWGGYNAFFVDISDFVHKGTNNIKVALKNNEGNVLAPYAGDFNFNATLGNVRLFTSPYLPSMSYGYDGFHITSTVSSAEATINVNTTIPTGATVVCTIIGDNCNYTETKDSTGEELVFSSTITNPHLWNGTIEPYLYNVKLEIYHDNELYHSYERPYGLRFYEYVFNQTVNGNPYTGFLLNGQPYLLRGVCVHDDLANQANALNDDDYTQEFNIITELGCNFLRLAHYPHPKEVYDWCDRLGIIVQTEAPWVNRSSMTETADYWAHLEGQCADMVNQHYNHPCIIFWGVGNEINTNYTNTTEGKDFVKGKIEGYRNTIRSLMPNALVGYTVSHGTQDGLGIFNNPTVDWIGQNIYVGWYIDKPSNNPTSRLTTAINKATTQNTPCAYSEYGCGGTPSCHSDNYKSTTTTGNNPRHDIEYQMWLHEGHIAAIKSKPELLFTSQWQLFDIAVSNRTEGYKVCKDGEESSVFDNDELKRLNNKGLVERDHKTKKDTYYLYKAWWNQTDKFVHICGKDYHKLTDRVIKCYTNDGSTLTLYVNDVEIETVTVVDNIATFTARNFNPGDVVKVTGDSSNDSFTITNYNIFTTEGNWNESSNWSANAVPTAGYDVDILANATVPSGCTANAGNVSLYGNTTTLTIADGGQLVSNSAVNATVQKNITAYTVIQNQGTSLSDGWHFISSPITDDYIPAGSMVENTYDLFRLNPTTAKWENYKNTTGHSDFTTLNNGAGYLYANSEETTLSFTGALKPYVASESVSVSTGWNLIGNPFTYNVYANRSFYKMNEAKTGVVAVSAFSTSPIAPCTGIVVKADNDGDVIFSKEAPAQSQGNNVSLQITLSQANTNIRNNAMLDNAIVSFNEGAQLQKFYFGEPVANIFIPQNGDDYAIIFSDRHGDVPVYFNANELGKYTISFASENMNLKDIYLIDLFEQQEIDLSISPSYTFIGSPSDSSERFKIVFKNNDDNKTFAYINNGNIIITADVEGATLQVIDVMGRMIVSREGDVSRNISTCGMAPGTYVLRLINGDKLMTQKIVIR